MPSMFSCILVSFSTNRCAALCLTSSISISPLAITIAASAWACAIRRICFGSHKVPTAFGIFSIKTVTGFVSPPVWAARDSGYNLEHFAEIRGIISAMLNGGK